MIREISTLFDAHSIPMVPTLAASTPDEAVSKAESFLAKGLPVAVKILSRDITHKSDVGGVALGLTTRGAVRSAACEVTAKARRARPDSTRSAVARC